MIKMERNVYKAVQCAPLSEKDEEIHTQKIFYLRGSETRLLYHVKSNITITNRFILGLLINFSTSSQCLPPYSSHCSIRTRNLASFSAHTLRLEAFKYNYCGCKEGISVWMG